MRVSLSAIIREWHKVSVRMHIDVYVSLCLPLSVTACLSVCLSVRSFLPTFIHSFIHYSLPPFLPPSLVIQKTDPIFQQTPYKESTFSNLPSCKINNFILEHFFSIAINHRLYLFRRKYHASTSKENVYISLDNQEIIKIKLLMFFFYINTNPQWMERNHGRLRK